MIPLTLGEAISAYAIALACFLLAFILGRAFWRTRRAARALDRHIQCAVCGTIYENASAAALPPCPVCARPNERAAPPGP